MFGAWAMLNEPSSLSLPPSGPWSGYYLYGHGGVRHRMRLGLTFTKDGKIRGEGIDDIAPFVIHGTFHPGTNEAKWKKSYIGMHTVEYSGFYDQRTICGNWTLITVTGGFWIWPSAFKETERESVDVELEEPAQVVLV
jgi:hypothetical protein